MRDMLTVQGGEQRRPGSARLVAQAQLTKRIAIELRERERIIQVAGKMLLGAVVEMSDIPSPAVQAARD
jgi:hypothetical protein